MQLFPVNGGFQIKTAIDRHAPKTPEDHLDKDRQGRIDDLGVPLSSAPL
jgi:hypothetical protein